MLPVCPLLPLLPCTYRWPAIRHAAVVLRRGPIRHIAVIAGDRRHDRFSLGQWLNGLCGSHLRAPQRALPNGQHLIYFAMSGRWQPAAKGAWTTVSRAPYLKALELHAKGDCWHGGGLFCRAASTG